MPWADSHPAILQAWYGGNEAGNAIADILFGDTNPSGKLPLSLPIRNEDNPAFLNFRSEGYRMLYGEDVYVGYRFYEKTDKSVLFPFGHGLSYSVFVIDNLQVSESSETDPTLSITIDVYNQSNMDGCEVVQVYVRQCNPSINRPVKELKAFSKANIPANDKRSVQLSVKKRLATSFWDEKRDMWLMEKGQYKLLVGCSSAQIAQIATFQVEETHWWRGL